MYKDREEAGEKLAYALKDKDLWDPIVFGLARGGVPIATKVAEVLGCPLDVMIVQKLSSPRNPEFGFGAIAPGETEVIEWKVAEKLSLTPFDVQEIIKEKKRELGRRLKLYRKDFKYESLEGKTAILIDDGIATGVSIRAAIAFLSILEPRKIIVAAPVCAEDTAKEIEKEPNKLICLLREPNFMAVGQYYKEFSQVTDGEVIDILKKFKN